MGENVRVSQVTGEGDTAGQGPGPSAPVVVSSAGPVTTLALNRPAQLNAIDRHMALSLIAAVDAVSNDPKCRCLVITGTGRAFCSGQSLGSGVDGDALPRDIAGLIEERYGPLVRGLQNLAIPVIAAVNGLAAGAGLSLALAADIRICSESAWFSCAFAQIGLVPDSGATYFLPRYLGLGRALHYALTGERISAPEALAMGLVTKISPSSTFSEEAARFAAQLANGATRALAMTKGALYRSQTHSLESQLREEAVLQQAASETEDFAEGLAAFRAKRPASFNGH